MILKRLYSIISSGKTTGILLLVTAVMLAVATFIENSHSTKVARDLVYNSPVFFLILFLLALNFILQVSGKGYIRKGRFGFIILHLSFIIIMSGALLTHLMSKDGLLHLREGETSSKLQNSEGLQTGELPFEVTLEKFNMERYSNLGSPSSYESFIKIKGKSYHVYMNSFVKYKGYRLYQSSYDKDLKGSVLSVNYDPWGITVTYMGYILMLLGFIWSMAEKGSRFRALLKKMGIVLLLLTISNISLATNPAMESIKKEALLYSLENSIPDSIALKFSRLTIQTSEGRLEPVDTYSAKVLQKISKSTSFNGLNSNQVMMGICTQQPIWSYVPFIDIPDDTIKVILSLSKKAEKASYSDCFDKEGVYILNSCVDDIYGKAPVKRTSSEKNIIKFDERINIISSLMSGSMLRIFPREGSKQWYSPTDEAVARDFQHMDSMFVTSIIPYLSSTLNGEPNHSKASQLVDMISLYQQKKGTLNYLSEKKIDAEMLYNRLHGVKISGFGFMTFGLILIVLTVISLISSRNLNSFLLIFHYAVISLFLFFTFTLGLRWYISGSAPWSNAYESVVYVGWATSLIGLCMNRKSKMISSLAIFFAGAILFVSNLSFMDPQITPLVPVLKSYWLIIHVATITASYGFFGVSFLIGLTTLIIISLSPTGKYEKEITGFTASNELLMWIGLALMTIGTFLGAVWANQSWGRYWGWDPKETWALITVIVYALVLHTRYIFPKRTNLAFAILSVFALGSVLMTFFGVNYYLTGLHSYAGGSSPVGLKAIWISYGVISAISIVAIYRGTKN